MPRSKSSQVLIIGAGGSKPYGFPTGDEMYNEIKRSLPKVVHFVLNEHQYTKRNDWEKDAIDFSEQLKRTSSVSVDKYLNINTGFLDIGIRAIALNIFKHEKDSTLPFDKKLEKEDWYSYLYKKITQSIYNKNDLFEISDTKISFITFNYDRSLEHYLFENLYGLFVNSGITREELFNYFKELDFLHVYGSLGRLPWQTGVYGTSYRQTGEKFEYISYGKASNRMPLEFLSKDLNISLMYENRKLSNEIKKAQELIANASRVLFLGFGYDEKNLEILGLPQLLRGKKVFGTALGSTKNEIIHIKKLLGLKLEDNQSDIYDNDCLMLLKEHLL